MVMLGDRLGEMDLLNQEELRYLLSLFTPARFRKGQLLAAPGQVLHDIYYIESGFTRAYMTGNQNDETIWVKSSGDFIMPNGFSTGVQGHCYIEFLSNATAFILLSGHPATIREPLLCKLLFRLYDEEIQLIEKREIINHIHQADDRYQLFKTGFPQLYGKINNQVIASFLRMSVKHFVRLKKADLFR